MISITELQHTQLRCEQPKSKPTGKRHTQLNIHRAYFRKCVTNFRLWMATHALALAPLLNKQLLIRHIRSHGQTRITKKYQEFTPALPPLKPDTNIEQRKLNRPKLEPSESITWKMQ